MGAPVTHFEISGKDGQKLADFYRRIFDWQTRPTQGGPPYWLVQKEGQGIGGGIGASQDGKPMVTFYVEVPDTDAALKRIGELGGRTIVPTTTIPGMVTFALFADPEGNVVGLAATEVPPKA